MKTPVWVNHEKNKIMIVLIYIIYKLVFYFPILNGIYIIIGLKTALNADLLS
jgi:hypothetical protein